MPVVAAVAGVGLAVYGQVKANQAQADAANQNAAYYNEQANFSQQVEKREEDVFYNRSNRTIAQQQSAYTGAGVAASGSALAVAEDQYLRQAKEASAIKMMGGQKTLMATTQAGVAGQLGATYGSTGYNAVGVGGTVLSGIGQIARANNGGGD